MINMAFSIQMVQFGQTSKIKISKCIFLKFLSLEFNCFNFQKRTGINFKNKAKCFVDQYNNFTSKQINRTVKITIIKRF